MGYITSHLRSLEEQHRKLDEEIRRMSAQYGDDTLVKRAKQQKLRLKDEINQIKIDEKQRQRSDYQP